MPFPLGDLYLPKALNFYAFCLLRFALQAFALKGLAS